MMKVVNLSWLVEDEKKCVERDVREMKELSLHWYEKVVKMLRGEVLNGLKSKFGRLSVEDLEEVYDDGCMVLWEKMEEGLKLEGKSVVGYLKGVCWRIAMHYLRGVRSGVESLEELMERNMMRVSDELSVADVFDVMEDGGMDENEKLDRIDSVWEKLSDVDRMILEGYYWEGLKMEEIALKIGYGSSKSVKSRKNKILKKMKEEMKDASLDANPITISPHLVSNVA